MEKRSTEGGVIMTINEGMRKYRLPNPTIPEDLECRRSKLLTYGDRIIIAGHYWNGYGTPLRPSENVHFSTLWRS